MAKSKVLSDDQIIKIKEQSGVEREISKVTNMLRDQGIPDKTLQIHNAPAGMEREDPSTLLRVTQVCWAFPMDEVLFQDFFVNVWRMRPMPWDEVLTVKDTYLPSARNKIHSQFVNEAKSTWLVMIDSDVLPPPNFVEKMLLHHKRDPRKKVLSGYYHVKGEPYNPTVYEYVTMLEAEKLPYDTKGHEGEVAWYRQYTPEEENLRREAKRLEKVTGVGAGCIVMHREVAAAIGEQPYDMSEGGEDLTLCRKITDAGYDIWVDWSMACAHVGVAWA